MNKMALLMRLARSTVKWAGDVTQWQSTCPLCSEVLGSVSSAVKQQRATQSWSFARGQLSSIKYEEENLDSQFRESSCSRRNDEGAHTIFIIQRQTGLALPFFPWC